MSQGQGTISANDLMKKLVQAKKVMNKVDSGSYSTGHVNEQVLRSSPEETSNNHQLQSNAPLKPVGTPNNHDRINQSKLPDAIKRAMIESPISQISLNDTLDMDFVKGVQKLMEADGVSTKTPEQRRLTQQQSQYQQPQTNTNDLISLLTPIIENIIRKVMDEKLNQILSAQTTSTINENLVLKVGDSIFRGKITGVNKAK